MSQCDCKVGREYLRWDIIMKKYNLPLIKDGEVQLNPPSYVIMQKVLTLCNEYLTDIQMPILLVVNDSFICRYHKLMSAGTPMV